jgi:hypothetical protein
MIDASVMKCSGSGLINGAVGLDLLLEIGFATGKLDGAELGQSQWIGFTQDSRPEKKGWILDLGKNPTGWLQLIMVG